MGAVERVRGHQKLETVSGQPEGLNTPGIHLHALSNCLSAGCDWLCIARHLNKAQTAGGCRLSVIAKRTQVGDIDTIVQRYPEEFLPLFSSYFFAINN